MKGRVLILLTAAMLLLSACAIGTDQQDGKKDAAEGVYQKITAEEAKAKMDEEDVTIVDVRTKEEYDEGHIPDAILLPVENIGKDPPKELPDKDAVLLIYCRSGRRSKDAANELLKLGYKNVYDFGGIIDWPYDTVKEE